MDAEMRKPRRSMEIASDQETNHRITIKNEFNKSVAEESESRKNSSDSPREDYVDIFLFDQVSGEAGLVAV